MLVQPALKGSSKKGNLFIFKSTAVFILCSSVYQHQSRTQTPAGSSTSSPSQPPPCTGIGTSMMAETVRRNCRDLGQLFRHVEAQLDGLCHQHGPPHQTAPGFASSPQLADLVESVTTVMKAVDQFCTVLSSSQLPSNSPPDSAQTKTPNIGPSSVTGTPTTATPGSRGLPPPVLPKPPPSSSSSAMSSRLCSPATPRITDRPLPPPPSDAELARALQDSGAVVNGNGGGLSGPDCELVSFYELQASFNTFIFNAQAN